MATWPTLPDCRSYLRLQPDPKEDAIIDQARQAAISYGVRRMGRDPTTGDYRFDVDTTTLDEHIRQAAMIHTARLYKRRDSTDGTVGFGDMGVIRIGRVDADGFDLYGESAPLVFA